MTILATKYVPLLGVVAVLTLSACTVLNPPASAPQPQTT
jgi:hypothetical protein